ncbi:MAG: helix-turn-helix transcriptional regulator [Eubacterium sp.]|jgi:DNA-binding Xre family transcriptional regulator|nr:helix-turn-helix transcriptional regulator [Eubacterium sp.]
MVSYDKLWILLINRHMSRTELRIKAGLSTSALAQLGKNDYVSLKIIEKICNVLDCDIPDVVELRKD